MKTLQNKYLPYIILTCFAAFFVNLDSLFVNIMEARNFITAREMLMEGNWILTTLNGEARYEKPPLPTWLTAFSAAIFGLKNLFALRLPAAIMALVLVVTSYKFTIRFTTQKNFAFIGALILATSFYVVAAGRDGNWDIFTYAFMMLCIYQCHLLFTRTEKYYLHALLAGIFFGCSFMSKGPVSMYALFLPFLISFGLVYKFKNLKSLLLPFVLFLVVSAVTSGWWYWYIFTYDPHTLKAIAHTETQNWASYNIRPFYYYWSFFTQSGVWTIPAFVGLLYPYLKNRVFDKKAYLLTLLWTFISLLLLSIIPEKKSRYLLPVLIPLALNTAFYIEYLMRRFSEITDKRESFPVYFNFGLIACIGLAFPIGGYFILDDSMNQLWGWYLLLSLSLIFIAIYMFRFLIRKKIRPVFYLTIAFIAAVTCFGLPMAKSLTINPEYKDLSELNSWQEESGLEVFEFSYFTPELIWDYGKPIKVLNQNGTISLPTQNSFGLLVSIEDRERFNKAFADYSQERIMRFDMNPKAKDDHSHKSRLVRELYLLTKKN